MPACSRCLRTPVGNSVSASRRLTWRTWASVQSLRLRRQLDLGPERLAVEDRLDLGGVAEFGILESVVEGEEDLGAVGRAEPGDVGVPSSMGLGPGGQERPELALRRGRGGGGALEGVGPGRTSR